MRGRVTAEREVKAPASEAWKVYGTLKLSRLAKEILTDVISDIDEQGDGGVGTILHIFFKPDGMVGGLSSYKEKFTVVDDERQYKVAELVEGGYLDLGFTAYKIVVEVVDKEGEPNECITRVGIEYELKEEAASNVALVYIQPYIALMQAIADQLQKNCNSSL